MRHVPRAVTPRPAAIGILAVVLVAALAAPTRAAVGGRVGWQASYGWYTQIDDSFLGFGARLPAGRITVVPNVDWLFEDHGSVYTLNLDATASLRPHDLLIPYVGGGLGMLTVDPDRGNSRSDMTVNLIAGAGFDTVVLKPFAQLKYVIVDGDDPIVLSFGARF